MKDFRTLLFSLALIFICIKSKAQDVVVYYDQVIDLGEPQHNNYELYITQHQSLYFDVSKKNSTKISENQKDNLSTYNIIEEHKPNHIFVDFSNQSLNESTYLGENNYVIAENLYPFDWKITNDTKQIANYICTKATTTFRGRSYEVWFTEQIPTNAGPWKMHSLPGLILEMYDTEQLILIQAKKVFYKSFGKEQTDLISKIKNSKKKNYKEYDKLLKNHTQEIFNQMASKMPEGFPQLIIDEDCKDCQILEIYEEWEL